MGDNARRKQRLTGGRPRPLAFAGRPERENQSLVCATKILHGAWSSSVFPTDPRHQREPNAAFCLCPTTIRSHLSSAARRLISSTGSPTPRCPPTVKPFFLSLPPPSS